MFAMSLLNVIQIFYLMLINHFLMCFKKRFIYKKNKINFKFICVHFCPPGLFYLFLIFYKFILKKRRIFKSNTKSQCLCSLSNTKQSRIDVN